MVNQSKAASPIFRERWLHAGALASAAGRVKAPVMSRPVVSIDGPVINEVLRQRMLAADMTTTAAQRVIGYLDRLIQGGSFKIEWRDGLDGSAHSVSGEVESVNTNHAWPIVSLHGQSFGIYLQDITSLESVK